MKTNKAFKKRLKITRSGKVLARPSGHNHYNAKESRVKQLARKGFSRFVITNKSKSRFVN